MDMDRRIAQPPFSRRRSFKDRSLMVPQLVARAEDEEELVAG